MTRDAAAPHTNASFLVDMGGGDARAPEAGFCEVVFPPFVHDGNEASRRLILKRGVTGSLDLYRWWDAARRQKDPPKRTVRVQLMTPDLSRPVLTWTFRGARPLALTYTPLNALEAAVLVESIEVEFERVDIE